MRIFVIVFCLLIVSAALVYSYMNLPPATTEVTEAVDPVKELLDNPVAEYTGPKLFVISDNEYVEKQMDTPTISFYNSRTLVGSYYRQMKYVKNSFVFNMWWGHNEGSSEPSEEFNGKEWVNVPGKTGLEIICKKGIEEFKTDPRFKTTDPIWITKLVVVFSEFHGRKNVFYTPRRILSDYGRNAIYLELNGNEPFRCDKGNSLDFLFHYLNKDGSRVVIDKVIIETANFGNFECKTHGNDECRSTSFPNVTPKAPQQQEAEANEFENSDEAPQEELPADACEKEPWLCEQHD
jgi:hypothetical protein